MDPLWLATGRRSADWVGEEERDLLELFRGLPDDLREKLVEMAWMIRVRFEARKVEMLRAAEDVVTYGRAEADHPPGLASVYRLADVSTRPTRLVGTVAARSEPSWSFDQRSSGELLQVPEELWFDGCQVVRARGDSLRDVGIADGDLLVCKPQKIGHRRGDIVIAKHAEHGMLVKVYGGQRRGVITLRSANDGAEPITGTLDEIEICGVVKSVYREG